MLNSPPDSSVLDSLSAYPRWLVMAVATLVAVLVIWLAAKILKVALYLLMVLVLVGGVIATFWYLFH